MKQKELNLCELLKGCEGMEFYSPIIGDCLLLGIDDKTVPSHPISIAKDNLRNLLRKDGKKHKDGELMLMPSKEVRTWDNWVKPIKRWKPKEGDVIHFVYLNAEKSCAEAYESPYDGNGICGINEFRTKEQAEEAAKRVRETLEKYHEEIGE